MITRYIRSRPKRRRRSTGGGGKKDIIDGLIAGAAATLIKKYINVPFADDAAMLAVGYFRHNTTLKTIGAIGLGSDLVGSIPAIGGVGGGVQYLG